MRVWRGIEGHFYGETMLAPPMTPCRVLHNFSQVGQMPKFGRKTSLFCCCQLFVKTKPRPSVIAIAGILFLSADHPGVYHLLHEWIVLLSNLISLSANCISNNLIKATGTSSAYLWGKHASS